jgi:hypothetical protein
MLKKEAGKAMFPACAGLFDGGGSYLPPDLFFDGSASL